MSFPIDLRNERELPPDWRGEVVVCDIDRTYLYTRFSSIQGISRIPFEFAVDKQDIEGMAPLLREVRRGPERRSRVTPLYFVSASPAQLRPVIQRKMLLDGLEFDGTTFKDWLGVARSLRPKRFKEQLGFKITALLTLIAALPPGAELTLIGDDLETDALAFALLADAVAGRLGPRRLERLLRRQGTLEEDARHVLELLWELPEGVRGVRRAYIRMERHGSPDDFLSYWPHLTVCRGALQMALGLWGSGSIALGGVVRVAEDLLRRGQRPETLLERLLGCCRRGILRQEQTAEAHDMLVERGLVPPLSGPCLPDPAWSEAAQRRQGERWTPDEELDLSREPLER